MWFITVFETIKPDAMILANFGSQRTWGYYSDEAVAVQALNENWTDMREYLYDYAVIEKFGEGLCPLATERKFFKWDNERNGYYIIDEPECCVHLCNFAIG